MARKGLPLALTYSINGGRSRALALFGARNEYNTKAGLYYSRYQAVISGQQAGDVVTYQVSGGSICSRAVRYNVANATGDPILLVFSRRITRAPNSILRAAFYLNYYTDALDASGYSYDV